MWTPQKCDYVNIGLLTSLVGDLHMEREKALQRFPVWDYNIANTQFNQLFQLVLEQGPQIVTNGESAGVLYGLELDLERDKDPGREIDLSD